MWIDANIFIAVVICYVLYVIMHWRFKRDVLELKNRVIELWRVQRAIEERLMDTSTTMDSNLSNA